MKFLSVRILLVLVAFYLLLGASAFHFIENNDWVDSFYFATATISTVGYGDIVPLTDLGKLFSIFYILFGVSITAYAFSVVGSYVIKYHIEKTIEERLEDKKNSQPRKEEPI